MDLGTSSVKMLIMDNNGQVVKIVSKEYPIMLPKSGWTEQNPKDWWDKTSEGLKELTDGIDKELIKGIAFGGQMHGLVILDENDEVIRPAILWNDSRAQAETDYLNNEIGRGILSKETGNIAFAGFTAPKLIWLKKNEPENFAKIRKIMLPKDYLVYKLTGRFVTDVSDASGTLFFDVSHRKWSKKMLEICSITEDKLPNVLESYEPVGHILAKASEATGLSKNTLVVAGAADNASAAIGTGTVGTGKCNISLGTSGTVFITSNSFCVDVNNSIHSFCHADGGYHLMGCILSAASCNKWWSENILETKSYKEEQANITKLGENSVFFLPSLLGERSPINDTNARGAFIGMSIDTTRADMTQAVFEGVAFALRSSYRIAKFLGIKIDSATICGGGAKSELWCRIIANVLGINISTISVEEGPSYGGAILASVGCGQFETVEQACNKLVKVDKTYYCDPVLVEKYNKKYKLFKKIYPSLKSVFTEMREQ